MENDGTALKPAIQYEEKQQINVGLKMTADIEFVKANPVPKSEFLKENVVTEANVTYLSTTDNGVAMPVSVIVRWLKAQIYTERTKAPNFAWL